MVSQSVRLLCYTAIFVATLCPSIFADGSTEKFTCWSDLDAELKSLLPDLNNETILKKDVFDRFIAKHPKDEVMKDIPFEKLKEKCSLVHDREILAHEFMECYIILGTEKFNSWLALYQELKSLEPDLKYETILKKDVFDQFIAKNPKDAVMKDVPFEKLKGKCSYFHEQDISTYEFMECYFTLSPDHLKYLMKTYNNKKNVMYPVEFKTLNNQASLFDQTYEEIVQIDNKRAGITAHYLCIDFLTSHYYLQKPSHLARLVNTFDKNNSGIIDKTVYDDLKTQFKIIKEGYEDVLLVLGKNEGDSLTTLDVVKYYFTENPKNLLKLVIEFVGKEYTLNKQKYDQINNKYQLWNIPFDTMMTVGDIDHDSELSVFEVVHYYFRTSRKRLHRAVKSVFYTGKIEIHDDQLSDFQMYYRIFDRMSSLDATDATDINRDGADLTIEELVAYFFTESPERMRTFFEDYDTDKNGLITENEYNKMEMEYKLFRNSFADLKNKVNKSSDKLKVEELIPYYYKRAIRQLIRAVKSFDYDFKDILNEEKFNNMEAVLHLFPGKSYNDIHSIVGEKKNLTPPDVVTIYFTQVDAQVKPAIKQFARPGLNELNRAQIRGMIEVYKIFKNYREARPEGHVDGKSISIDQLYDQYIKLKAVNKPSQGAKEVHIHS